MKTWAGVCGRDEPMTPQQRTAIQHPCLLAEETAHPRFGRRGPLGTVIVTVNSGFE